jgi:hypothetical protein
MGKDYNMGYDPKAVEHDLTVISVLTNGNSRMTNRMAQKIYYKILDEGIQFKSDTGEDFVKKLKENMTEEQAEKIEKSVKHKKRKHYGRKRSGLRMVMINGRISMVMTVVVIVFILVCFNWQGISAFTNECQSKYEAWKVIKQTNSQRNIDVNQTQGQTLESETETEDNTETEVNTEPNTTETNQTKAATSKTIEKPKTNKNETTQPEDIEAEVNTEPNTTETNQTKATTSKTIEKPKTNKTNTNNSIENEDESEAEAELDIETEPSATASTPKIKIRKTSEAEQETNTETQIETAILPDDLEDFVLSDDNTTLYEYTGDSVHVKIPDMVTTIATDAFQNMDNIRGITLPANIQKVEKGAFSGLHDGMIVYIYDTGTTRTVRFAKILAQAYEQLVYTEHLDMNSVGEIAGIDFDGEDG